MSDTPRTDAALLYSICLDLQDENNALKARIKRLEEMYEGEIGEQPELLGSNVMGLLKRELNFAQKRIKRLEEAGDAMAEWLENSRNLGADACLSHAWREAKEAKL